MKKYNNFPLSPIFVDMINTNCKKLFTEGTTMCGKTTVGIGLKAMIEIGKSNKPIHCICGKSKGIIEKNIINTDVGLKDIWGNMIEYKGNGTKDNSIPHIIFHSPNGDKIIYLAGYDNITSMEKVVGSQYGVVVCDEMNLANSDFLREIIMRCDFFIGTMNPDNPDLDCYKDFVNHSRPIEKYKDRVPESIMKELEECEEYEGWQYWFFTFNDNPSLSQDKIEERKRSAGKGKIYKNKILGLRGKAEGQCIDAFDKTRNVIKYNDLKNRINEYEKGKKKFFKYFTSGLDTSYSKKSDDTIAMTFVGITFDGTAFLLDEYVINNRDLGEERISPSDLCIKVKEFLDKNKDEWGYCSTMYVDNADQATLSELDKFRRKNGLIYHFEPCYKKKIIDRIYQLNGWCSDCKYMVVDTCFNHLEELDNYSWKDGTNKQEAEDKFNHTIDSLNYSIYPFENEIGGI